jgi:hypothetical protein
MKLQCPCIADWCENLEVLYCDETVYYICKLTGNEVDGHEGECPERKRKRLAFKLGL